jgi:V/A-type H+-transporting ATPase subunit F
MSKAVAIGEKHLILGFKGVGFEIIPMDGSERLVHELNVLSRDPEIGLVLVTESMAKDVPEALEEFRARSSAILTVIPTHEGSQRISFQKMRKSVERSMGVDILGKD